MRAHAAPSRAGSAGRTVILSAFSQEPRRGLRVTAPILPSVAVMQLQESQTVLVVDGGSTAAQLREQGFETVEAPNGAVALTLAAEPRIDAVVLDAHGPIIDGLELCRRVRAAGNELPILLVAGQAGV